MTFPNQATEAKPDKNQFFGYSDMSYANNDNTMFISGYAFIMGGGMITWGSKMQTSVSLSSTESKYVALADMAREIMWLWNLLEGLGYKQCSSTKLYGDNNGVLVIAQNPQYHKCTKHFDT